MTPKPETTRGIAERLAPRWVCSYCNNSEYNEREVVCWACGKGEMQFRPDPSRVAAIEAELEKRDGEIERLSKALRDSSVARIETRREVEAAEAKLSESETRRKETIAMCEQLTQELSEARRKGVEEMRERAARVADDQDCCDYRGCIGGSGTAEDIRALPLDVAGEEERG